MIKVWSDATPAGRIDRHERRGAAFAYEPNADRARAVSMTMPVRTASWNVAFGLHPIFEMNMPEGALRERLRLAFAKAAGSFDDFDLLTIVGRSQLGRLRYTAMDAELDSEVPFQSVDEILKHRRGGDLFAYMMERFAAYSGVSGVQPKVMVRDDDDAGIADASKARKSASVLGATHIVKLWNEEEYPSLAANEFYCLKAVERCGLPVPRFRISEDGKALVLDRFDLRKDGTYLGLEDFCVLNALSTSEKYSGGYETRLFRRLADFVPANRLPKELDRLFLMFVLNCTLRNGDAHLKNFALLYEDVNGVASLSPVYDVVTTTAYIPKDAMALTLNGSTGWPNRKALTLLGQQRCGLDLSRVNEVFERVAVAVSETSIELEREAGRYPGFGKIAEKMLASWRAGLDQLQP